MNEPSFPLHESRRALADGKRIARARHGEIAIEAVRQGADLYVCFARRKESGGIVWRVPLLSDAAEIAQDDAGFLAFSAKSELGKHAIAIEPYEGEAAGFHLRVGFTPAHTIHLPVLPRDLIAAGPDSRPDRPRGKIEAKQGG